MVPDNQLIVEEHLSCWFKNQTGKGSINKDGTQEYGIARPGGKLLGRTFGQIVVFHKQGSPVTPDRQIYYSKTTGKFIEHQVKGRRVV
jgi:hypothetical protein